MYVSRLSGLFRLPTPMFNADGAGGGGAGTGAAGGDQGAGAGSGGGGSGTPPPAVGGGATPQADGGAPWYQPLGLDADSIAYIEDRRFPDLNTAMKSGREAHALIRSRNVFERPDPSRLDDWGGWADLGWTPNRNEYGVDRPQFPEGFEYDQGFEKAFVDAAHKAKIPQHQVKQLFSAMMGHVVSQVTAAQQQADNLIAEQAREAEQNRSRMMTQLEGKWGNELGRNTELAKRAMRTLGIGTEAATEIEQIIGSPRLTELFYDLGKRMGEDSLVTADAGRGGLPTTYEGLRAELRRFQADRDNIAAMQDERNPRHGDVIAARQRIINKMAEYETKRK